jgi:hypothetical protein
MGAQAWPAARVQICVPAGHQQPQPLMSCRTARSGGSPRRVELPRLAAPLPAHGWHVHSIGCFTGRHGSYSIVLTQDNPSMTYGIRTIEAIATVIHRDLNP